MTYRLLAINIDGTLLKPNGRLPKATKEAVQYAVDKGIYVTLVTSRNFPSAKKIAKALRLNTQLITHGGAYVSTELDEPMYENRISSERTFEIVQFLEKYDCHIRLLHEKYSIGNRVRQRKNIMAKAVFASNDPLFYPVQFVSTLSNRLIEDPVSPPKIDLHFGDIGERDKVKNALEQAFPDLNVAISNDIKLEIVMGGASKLDGLRRVADHLGIPMDQTMAIGDSFTDIDMLRGAGLGIAMRDAPVEVKKAADWITRSNNQNGVGYIIKEQFRKQVGPTFLRKVKK